LAARVRELSALAISKEEQAVREQHLLAQDEAKVLNVLLSSSLSHSRTSRTYLQLHTARDTLTVTRTEVDTLRGRATTISAEVQAQDEEVERLREFHAQLTTQKEKQTTLVRCDGVELLPKRCIYESN